MPSNGDIRLYTYNDSSSIFKGSFFYFFFFFFLFVFPFSPLFLLLLLLLFSLLPTYPLASISLVDTQHNSPHFFLPHHSQLNADKTLRSNQPQNVSIVAGPHCRWSVPTQCTHEISRFFCCVYVHCSKAGVVRSGVVMSAHILFKENSGNHP